MTQAVSWMSSERVLLRGGTIYSPSSPFATAMLVEGPVIAWLGDDSGADAHRDSADVVVDLDGAFVTPGFVDAHVHTTSTGLMLTGLDLSECESLADALALVRQRALDLRGGLVLGHGWDETRWPEHRPPSREEIDEATWGSAVYLSRIDVHSAVVSTTLLEMAPRARGMAGYNESGVVTREAHHVLREAALAPTGGERLAAQRFARDRAASLGIVSMHEMAGPTVSSEPDVVDLLQLSDDEPGPLVTAYWAELARDGGIERALAIGAYGVGGDLFVDGALGSRTACLHDPYVGPPISVGNQYFDATTVRDHVVATSSANMPAGFHVIGDAACATVVKGLQEAARTVSVPTMRALGHRLEHAEMLGDEQVAALAELGITASMQPMFDELWGGPGGMYEQRLGPERVRGMNRFADLVSAGVLVAFGSDAPVTRLGPWQAVRAAMAHSNPDQRLSARAAFNAHTRGGWRAIGRTDAGSLEPGAAAHYAIWSVEELDVQAPDDRVAAWSTDPRSGTPGLPVLSADVPLPACLRTVVSGRTVYDSGDLDGDSRG